MPLSETVVAASAPPSERSPLKGTGFRLLWAGESVSLAGTQITYMAVGVTAVNSLGATAWQMGVQQAAAPAAVLVFGLSAGVWADRHERRRLMIAANVARALVILAVPVLYELHALSVPALWGLAFVFGALTLLFDSALSAYLPGLLAQHQLERANAWLEGSAAVGGVAGPGLAGLLVQVMSAPLALLVDVGSYVVSCATLLRLPDSPPAGRAGRAGAPVETHGGAVRAGLRLLRHDPVQRPMVLASAQFNVFNGMFSAVYALFVLRVLGFGPGLLGACSVAGGAAGVLGAATVPRLTRLLGQGRALIAAYAVPGLSALLVPLAAHASGRPVAVALVAASSFSWTFAVTTNLVITETVKQTVVPAAMLGRVTATTRFIAWGVQPVGAVLGGVLAEALGLAPLLTLAAAGLLTSPAWLLRSPVRTLTHATAPGSPPARAE